MLFSVFMGIAVTSADDCVGLPMTSCLSAGCYYSEFTGCSSVCADVGIPAPFNYLTCDMICDLAMAAQMFCAETCGLCPPPPVGAWRSDQDCMRQEMSVAIQQEIFNMLATGDYSAVNPCLTMESHLDDIFNGNDELVGTPNPLHICGCLEFFTEDFAKEHLNCMLAGYHIADLTEECRDIGGYGQASCDVSAIESEMQNLGSTVCSGFASGAAAYGTSDFDPSTVCECVHSFEPTVAGKLFNCMMSGSSLMDLYTNICPAYENPCDKDVMIQEMMNEVIAEGRIDEVKPPCINMELHFNRVLDSNTMPLSGTFVDYATICQCLGLFPRRFVDDHLRCGIAGTDVFSLWTQCSSHTPKCEDLTCSQCEERVRCSMHTDGTCNTYCPADGTCLDDPAVDKTCADL